VGRELTRVNPGVQSISEKEKRVELEKKKWGAAAGVYIYTCPYKYRLW
jgi:hypothetical protein